MGIKERIIEFCKTKDMPIKVFEERCGMSNGYVSSIRKGIGIQKLENVLSVFPELNRDWLLYGEGEMLRFKEIRTTNASLKDRIKSIAAKYEYSIRSFEEHCQLGRGNISNMADDGAIGSDKLSKIIDNFPDISIRWLLTGEGGMFDSESPKREMLDMVSVDEVKALLKENGRLEGKIEILEHELSEQKKENQRLIDFLRNRHAAGKGFVAVK